MKDSYQLKEGSEELVWNRRWLRKLPPHLFQHHSLLKLNLQHNCLTTLPSEISLLCNLTDIIVSNNLIAKLPTELGRLTKLSSLDLGQNCLTSVPIEILITLTNLHTLNISYNKITTLPPNFSDLTCLHTLTIKGNKLEALPEQLTALQELYLLDVSQNSLNSLPKSIKHMYSLRMLQLSRNNLSRIPSFRGLTNLVHLDVSSNRLSNIPPKLSLIVDVSTTQDFSEEAIPSIGKLRELNVRDNKDLFELPPEILNLRPPLTLYSRDRKSVV